MIEQHDALRLRFTEANGEWQATHQPVSDAAVLWQVRVPSMDKCEALFADAQRSLDLAQGPLLRAVLVDGPEGQQRLFIAIHHLVVDGVSWRVLLDDLQTVYRQLDAEQAVKLPAKTSAFKDWTARLQAYAGSESLREELNWWQTQLAGPER